ncbi:hypothetical protein [Cupriavidus numazuensis]|uniref:Uncharacterized protein n=1 Tax=Cupriavidus numazuensis TaxID=221992 RepID=A0ABM8TKE2_9BURK|nr:hypothetical protein [Cupriavidus numazuensis]CAG2151343.1 hypothetical protein LMG26411_03928 [Cupriavidus numazuensis]
MRLKHIGIAAGIAAAFLAPGGAYAQPGRIAVSCQAAMDARGDVRAEAAGTRAGCRASFDPFTDGMRAGHFDPFTEGLHGGLSGTAQIQRNA